MDKGRVFFRDLGVMGYQTAWDLQESLLKQNVALKTLARQEPTLEETAQTTNHLLFVEHPPVYTLGKSGKLEHVLITEQQRAEKDIAFFSTNRGGDITFHGPGQLVGYPILDLENFYTDIGRYLRSLEEVVIVALRDLGIESSRSAGETGVWIDAGRPGHERKICAMGVRCSRWITMHGFALNVNTDLDYFNHIVPCGIRGKKVTSIAAELGEPFSMETVKSGVKKAFEEVFEVRLSGSEMHEPIVQKE